jgi:hypothetical protein
MKINRKEIAPSLVRIFYNHGSFHQLDEFQPDRQPLDELSLFVWPDTTLGELTMMLSLQLPAYCDHFGDSDQVLAWRLIHCDQTASFFESTELGMTSLALQSPQQDERKTLARCCFLAGDWIDVAIIDAVIAAANLKR